MALGTGPFPPCTFQGFPGLEGVGYVQISGQGGGGYIQISGQQGEFPALVRVSVRDASAILRQAWPEKPSTACLQEKFFFLTVTSV